MLQISLPTLDPARLLRLGERLRPLRDDGVLIIGSGFTTHGLPFLHDPSPDAVAPGWSVDFDQWARGAARRGRRGFAGRLPRHGPRNALRAPDDRAFAPLFVALGASGDPEQRPRQVIDGYWMGLAKRSIELS